MGGVAVKLLGGPFDEYMNVYPLAWPPPERIVAFRVGAVSDGGPLKTVAVADAVHLEAARAEGTEATVYARQKMSAMSDAEAAELSFVIRGAEYTVVSDDEG